MSQHIVVGDVLMGPDSSPRFVTSICSGEETLYKITPKKGDPYIVNESHILSLKRTREKKSPRFPCENKAGDICNISIKEYLAKSKNFKHIYKGWRSAVDFKGHDKEFFIPPYLLGVWLGDGDSNRFSITTGNNEISEYLEIYAKENNFIFKKKFNSKNSVICHLTDEKNYGCKGGAVFPSFLRKNNLFKNKHIPHDYKTSSRKNRLELLAGIIDTDGHYDKKGYDLCLKNEKLLDDVIYIARSLGFSAYKKQVKKKCYNNDKIGTYYRCAINGDIDEIPVKISYKKANKRKINKSPLLTGITVTNIGVGKYFGFELRGKDRLFLLGDFTVTHNTHIIKALVNHYTNQNQRVLILAHRKELLEQAGTILGDKDFCYYSASIGEKRMHKPVVIAGIQSIYNKPMPTAEEAFDHIIIDECHRLSNERDGQYWQLIDKLPNAKITGLSATPYRLKGGELSWGEIVYEIGYAPLFDAGWLCKLTNKVPPSAVPNLADIQVVMNDYIANQLEEVMTDTKLMFAAVEKIKQYSPSRKSCLIFCVSVKHAELLKWMMREYGIEDTAIVTGETSQTERGIIIEDFKQGKIKFLLNCEVLLEGFDAPRVDMIVCLRPTKSRGLWEQMIGRGIRMHAEKKDCLLLDMAGNLSEHGGFDAPRNFAKGKERKVAPGRICPQCETFCKPITAQGIGLECPDCGFQFPEPEANKVDHNYDHDSTSEMVYRLEPETYRVRDIRYSEHKSRKGNITLRVDYFCEEYVYNCISEYLSPHSDNDWARNRVYQFFKERGVDIGGDPKDMPMENLLWNAQYLNKPTEITVIPEGKYMRIKDYIYGKPDRESSPLKDISLENDFIPY